jgi:hypothetical protein
MIVMPGPVPGIHVFTAAKTWMAGTVPGHDELRYNANRWLTILLKWKMP